MFIPVAGSYMTFLVLHNATND